MFTDFMANTWIAGSIVAVVAGVVGFFVVLRGASFAAHALPLGAFPGAAAATLLGVDRVWGMIAFTLLGALAVGLMGHRGRRDVATALSLVMLLALGALLLSMTRAYGQSVYALLFGEVLGVGRAEIVLLGAAGAVAAGATLLLFRPLLLGAVSAELGEASGMGGPGMSERSIELCFLMVLALATATALPVVGALLVFSLMIGPAAAARALSRRPVPAMLCSVALALLTVWAAITLSYISNWPIGFFVGLLGVLSYGAGRLALAPANG